MAPNRDPLVLLASATLIINVTYIQAITMMYMVLLIVKYELFNFKKIKFKMKERHSDDRKHA